MGGYVALEVMRVAPERVARLALLDTSARADTPEQTRARRDLIGLARSGLFDEVPRRLLPNIVHPDRIDDLELASAVFGMARAVGPEAFVRQEQAIIARPDRRENLRDIACPALVLCGREDAVTPAYLHEEMADLIPGSRLIMVERCGHLSTLERPGGGERGDARLARYTCRPLDRAGRVVMRRGWVRAAIYERVAGPARWAVRGPGAGGGGEGTTGSKAITGHWVRAARTARRASPTRRLSWRERGA